MVRPSGAAAAAAVEELLPGILERRPRALARAISLVEDGGGAQRQLIQHLFSRTGKARLVGVTGPPGSGKSTLVDRLARRLRGRSETVGILAVDPTSPYSGGALLGDRIRMQALYTDPGVFIRSMATRGAMGGLTHATHDAIDVLDAAGFDWILLETVGVGQDEVDVVRSVDTVLVVTVPGLGDDIQAIKAGIMEIADVFVINKADQEGADRTVRHLETMLGLAESQPWQPPVLKTVARGDEGVGDLLVEIERHQEWLHESDGLEARRRARLQLRVETLLKDRVLVAAHRLVGLEREIEQGFRQGVDPYALTERLYAGVVQVESEAFSHSEGGES